MSKRKGNSLLTPEQFYSEVRRTALKHAKGDEKLAARLICAFGAALNSGPMRMGK